MVVSIYDQARSWVKRGKLAAGLALGIASNSLAPAVADAKGKKAEAPKLNATIESILNSSLEQDNNYFTNLLTEGVNSTKLVNGVNKTNYDLLNEFIRNYNALPGDSGLDLDVFGRGTREAVQQKVAPKIKEWSNKLQKEKALVDEAQKARSELIDWLSAYDPSEGLNSSLLKKEVAIGAFYKNLSRFSTIAEATLSGKDDLDVDEFKRAIDRYSKPLNLEKEAREESKKFRETEKKSCRTLATSKNIEECLKFIDGLNRLHTEKNLQSEEEKSYLQQFESLYNKAVNNESLKQEVAEQLKEKLSRADSSAVKKGRKSSTDSGERNVKEIIEQARKEREIYQTAEKLRKTGTSNMGAEKYGLADKKLDEALRLIPRSAEGKLGELRSALVSDRQELDAKIDEIKERRLSKWTRFREGYGVKSALEASAGNQSITSRGSTSYKGTGNRLQVDLNPGLRSFGTRIVGRPFLFSRLAGEDIKITDISANNVRVGDGKRDFKSAELGAGYTGFGDGERYIFLGGGVYSGKEAIDVNFDSGVKAKVTTHSQGPMVYAGFKGEKTAVELRGKALKIITDTSATSPIIGNFYNNRLESQGTEVGVELYHSLPLGLRLNLGYTHFDGYGGLEKNIVRKSIEGGVEWCMHPYAPAVKFSGRRDFVNRGYNNSLFIGGSVSFGGSKPVKNKKHTNGKHQ